MAETLTLPTGNSTIPSSSPLSPPPPTTAATHLSQLSPSHPSVIGSQALTRRIVMQIRALIRRASHFTGPCFLNSDELGPGDRWDCVNGPSHRGAPGQAAASRRPLRESCSLARVRLDLLPCADRASRQTASVSVRYLTPHMVCPLLGACQRLVCSLICCCSYCINTEVHGTFTGVLLSR